MSDIGEIHVNKVEIEITPMAPCDLTRNELEEEVAMQRGMLQQLHNDLLSADQTNILLARLAEERQERIGLLELRLRAHGISSQ